jgi:hypothetical protein
MPLPTFNYVNMLLEAGAEARSLGRVQWLDRSPIVLFGHLMRCAQGLHFADVDV